MNLLPGTSLGQYELLTPIAAGGMAQVWAAQQHGSRGFTKLVAMKLLLTEGFDDGKLVQMFLDEAELASRIKHPNVVAILDLGEEDGVLYQAMEYIDGESLQGVLREHKQDGGIPLDLAIRIGGQACAGLHAAHELTDAEGKAVGLVHRDVTPQNIMVTFDGRVKVLDFGVAKATTNLQQTTVGQLKGKAAYMSPEQARGDAVDRRTDVFALGIVLYQLTTGRHPFRGDNDLITLRAICAPTPAAPPEDMIEDYPEALNEVIVKALSKNADDRYSSMAEMGQALDRAALKLSIGGEELGAFVKRLCGERVQSRKDAIKAAIATAGSGIPKPRGSGRGRTGPTPLQDGSDPLDDMVPPPVPPANGTGDNYDPLGLGDLTAPAPAAVSTPLPAVVEAPASIAGAMAEDDYELEAMQVRSSQNKSMMVGVVVAAVLVVGIILAIAMAPESDAPKIPPMPTAPPTPSGSAGVGRGFAPSP